MSAVAENTLIKYLSEDTLTSLNETLDTIPQESVDHLVQSLESNPFTDPIVWNPERHREIQLISYQALNQGKISLDQFITCSLVTYAFEQFQQRHFEIGLIREGNKKPIQVVQNKEPIVLDSHFATIEQNTDKWNEILERIVDNLHHELEVDQKIEIEETFKSKLNSLPPSERVFFSYTIPVDSLVKVSPMLKVLQHQKVPFFLAEEPRDDDDDEKVVKITFISCSAFKTLLDIFNPERMQDEPYFGPLNTIKMREIFLRFKVALNLPFFTEQILKRGEQVQSADSHLAGPFGFAVHDLYHVWLKSRIKAPYLEACKEVVEALISRRDELNAAGYIEDAKRLSHDAWTIVDMDLNKIDLGGNPFRFILLFISDDAKRVIAEMDSQVVRDSIQDFDYLF